MCGQCKSKERQKILDRKREVLEAYGGCRCVCCDETELAFLSVDHIENNGNLHRKEIGGGGGRLYQWLKKHKYPPGFQVLCMNCQFGKRIHGICPHQTNEAR
jgi:hypothetical protein